MTTLFKESLILFEALFTGLITGAVFSWVGLPIPAPPALAGIIGIVGIYLGFIIINAIKH